MDITRSNIASMNAKLESHSVPTHQISRQQTLEMYDLFQNYYEATTYRNFTRDLNNKNWVVLLKEAGGKTIEGFSTLAFYESKPDGVPVGVVFSGDTIINKKFWGTPELPKKWVKTVLQVGQDYPAPLYWLLISSGYKTYRFLPVFLKEFYPRYDKPTPGDFQQILDYLAKERFGREYLQPEGIVRFSNGATPLREGVAEIKSNRLQDAHVKYFLQKNPGHKEGDELVCLTIIHPDNFTAAGKRMTR